uniref:Uncharacterized protein n=1 Tax=Populus trichocarpa TaxID=3694 RepID=A0A2K1X7F0_POPTR
MNLKYVEPLNCIVLSMWRLIPEFLKLRGREFRVSLVVIEVRQTYQHCDALMF